MTSAARPPSASSTGGVSAPSTGTVTSPHRNSNISTTRATSAKSTSSASSATHAAAAAVSASFDSQAAPLELDGSIPPAPPGPPAAVVVAATAGSGCSMLTVSQLESQSSAPSGYAGSGGRHVKDEIDELLYALQVREREIRMTRGGLETEIGHIRRSVKKMQRDTEELVRMQQQHTASMGSTLAAT